MSEKLLIIGVCQQPANTNKIYDYCACLHPFGYINSEDIFLFNSEKIAKVYHEGYFDDAMKDYYEDVIWSMNRGE